MTTSSQLDEKLFEIYKFLLKRYEETNIIPSVREICKEFDIKSTSSANYYINKLADKGYITIHHNISRGIELNERSARAAQFIDIPLLGTIAAGDPKFTAEDYAIDTFTLPKTVLPPKTQGPFFMLKVEGSSMIEAGIHEDDYIIVQQQATARNGQIVAALLDGDKATVKRYYCRGGEIRLHPENKEMSDIYPVDLWILGVVVGLIRTSVG
jgi:repressor LexA